MILEVHDLHKTYNHQGEDPEYAVRGLSFQVNKGEIFGLIGESGCGKSTTLKSIGGLLDIDAGRILVDGKVVKQPSQQLINGHPGVANIEQDFNLFENMSVIENIKHPLLKYTKEYQEYRIEELLRLCKLGEHQEHIVKELSGGQRQRVAFARAIADEPQLLLMDEPFSNLDAILRLQLREVIQDVVKETSTSVVFVTHDVQDALAIADRIAVMREGQIIQTGSSEDIHLRPLNDYVAHFSAHANVLEQEESEVLELKHPSDNQLLLIRPESVKQSAKGISSTIHKIEYIGAFNFLYLEVQGINKHLKMLSLSTHRYNLGQKMYIQIDQHFLHFINKSDV